MYNKSSVFLCTLPLYTENHGKIETLRKKNIYIAEMLTTILITLSLLSVNADLQRFTLKKKSDREFVAGVLARAVKGQK